MNISKNVIKTEIMQKPEISKRTVKALSKTFYCQLKDYGFANNDMMNVSNEILSLLLNDMKNKQEMN